MNGILRVSPQSLISTANEFSTQATSLNSLTSEMMSLITGLSSVWEGDASLAYINKFRALEDDIGRMVRMVQEHSSDLTEMAEGYTTAENANISDASSLSSNVIV